MNETLGEVWVQRCKLKAKGKDLVAEAGELWDEGWVLLDKKGRMKDGEWELWAERRKLVDDGVKMTAEGSKLWIEGNKLWAEGDKLYRDAVDDFFGEETDINWNTGGVT